MGPDMPDLLQRQLPGQHDPAGAQLVPHTGRLRIDDAGLGGDMDAAAGCIALRQTQNAQIRQDDGVCPAGIQKGQIIRQLRQLRIPGQGVHRYIDPNAPFMAPPDGLGQLLPAEIAGGRAHAEGLAGQIDGVCPVIHGEAELFRVAGRGQDLRADHCPAATFATALLCSASVRLKIWLPSALAT